MVVVGLREQDALLALGVVPVATTEWFGKHPGAIFPWAKEALGSATVADRARQHGRHPAREGRRAASRPDPRHLLRPDPEGLRLAVKLAPVIAQPKGQVDYGSSWQDEQLITGKAVGQPKKAQELVDEAEKLIADAAAEHPEFKGKTAANISDYQGIFVYGPEDVRTKTLEQLGFTYPDELRKAFPNDFGGQLSDERVDAVDVDALVWFADGDRSVEELKSDPSTRSCACARKAATSSSAARTASTRRPRSRPC